MNIPTQLKGWVGICRFRMVTIKAGKKQVSQECQHDFFMRLAWKLHLYRSASSCLLLPGFKALD